MEMKLYETSPEHALEYGLTSKKPLFLIGIFEVTADNKNQIERINEYAKNNGNDLVFGTIKEMKNKSFLGTEEIKNLLHDNGYEVNQENNDFYKLIKIIE